MPDSPYSRRRFLRYVGLSAGTLLGAQAAAAARPLPAPVLAAPRTGAPSRAGGGVEINIQSGPVQVPILPGQLTNALTFRGQLVNGSASVDALPDSFLGPVVRVRQGQHVRINYTSGLAEGSNIHHHGLTLPVNMAGHPHPSDTVAPGGRFLYEFDVVDRAGMHWFHPHPYERAGYLVNYGLAGLFIVGDESEDRLGLPSGDQERPLVIQDRAFDAANQMLYSGMGMGGGMGMGMMYGFHGNRILVNGRPDYVAGVAPAPHRLRILNGSNARVYRLAWSDGRPLVVFGTDGGLLPAPESRPYIMLAPAERIDVWADFTGQPIGTELALVSLPFPDDGSSMGMGMGGMGMGRMGGGVGGMGMGMRGGTTTSASPFTLARFRVEQRAYTAAQLPAVLPAPARYRWEDAVNRDNPRTFRLDWWHMNWFINGRTYEMESIAADERLAPETLEMWDYVNYSPIPHPMHIHNIQFNIVGRRLEGGSSANYEAVNQGFLDNGWKDTVLVMPGERVRLLVKFTHYAGMFMHHCHILEHEDMGMMRNLQVGDGDMKM